MPRSDATVGLEQELAKKLSLNSFARESKKEIDDELSRMYHIRARPLRVVGRLGTSASPRYHREPSRPERPQHALMDPDCHCGPGFAIGGENPGSFPPLASSGGDFILTKRRVGRTLSLTFVDTPGEAATYGESVGAKVWREGVVCHAALMACGESSTDASSSRFHLGCRRGHELARF
ncbi:hypothetical protein B296_00031153 [Ensete ventricosum]|uniref:Uncharacterized protein n=1 Tax=Ensete ventricosum TaxID=4639 RepID=A0A427AH76_ENSVE|nr:hypothetical protein B296_00031153 [Ensete ventricosum]